jgi:CopG family nickel-responsive transcriptional regulator
MRTGERVTRISLSLPPELLRHFDDASTKSGFSDRSKAAQAALRNFIGDQQQNLRPNEPVTAVVTVVYDHETRGIDAALTDIEHEIAESIASSMHVHLGTAHCLKIVVLKDNATSVVPF